MKTILYPPTINWDFLKQRPQQICTQFAKEGYNVIYCNNTQSNTPPQKIEKNLTVYHSFKDVLQKIQSGKMTIDILYYTWAKNKEYIPLIKPKLIIFDNVDLFPEWERLELDAIRDANVVLCTSQKIYDLRRKEHENVYLVRNGCDSSLFDSEYSTPEDMIELDGSVCMVGALGSWVLTSLMKKIAHKHKTIFVGKEFPKECPSNVINLGLKNHRELINYYKSSSVGLIPFNTKLELIQACDPIKMYEYLACGLPVVATSWHETELHKDVVLTSNDYDEFLSNVDKALILSKDESFKQKCISVARENTWEERFKVIHQAIKDFEKGAKSQIEKDKIY